MTPQDIVLSLLIDHISKEVRKMKRFVFAVLCVVLFGTACSTGHLSETSPRDDPILRELNKANCAYAALYVDNNYKWTVTLYVNPLSTRLGSVTPGSRRFFCINESHIKDDYYLFIRIRSHNQPRQSGERTVLNGIRKGDVWKLFIPSSISLKGWQYSWLSYDIIDEEEKPKR